MGSTISGLIAEGNVITATPGLGVTESPRR
jgi:hypothetical protein